MPLQQWTAFYRAAEAMRLTALADQIGVVHPKNPRRAADRLRASARRVLGGKGAGGIDLLAEPERLKRALAGMGVSVVTEEKKP